MNIYALLDKQSGFIKYFAFSKSPSVLVKELNARIESQRFQIVKIKGENLVTLQDNELSIQYWIVPYSSNELAEINYHDEMAGKLWRWVMSQVVEDFGFAEANPNVVEW